MKVQVPDLGDFADVPVIEILVAVGDEVQPEDPLIVLESDKATMEIPAPQGGTVEEILVKVGDTVSKGSDILALAGGPNGAVAAAEPEVHEASSDGAPAAPEAGAPAPAAADGGEAGVDVVVLGAGPGGYTAAFRAADLGLQTVLVERYERLGGVCLNVGCIPSKALLHVAKVITDAEDAAHAGLTFAAPEIDLDGVRAFKDGAVGKLTGGLDGLAKAREVRVVHGRATFTGPNALQVGDESITFKHCIIAAGSAAATLPGVPDDPRVVDSTGALELEDVPERLLVVGGGIIGLELATVYDALGARVTVVEMAAQLIPGCDPDLVKPLHKRIAGRYEAIHLETTVEEMTATDAGIVARFAGGEETFDRVLVAVGRRPNGKDLGLDAAGVRVDDRGYVPADEQQRTNIPHIFSIGDVCREPLLAHKAMHEAKVAAEVAAGQDVAFTPLAIPSVAYTDPEIAWAGLTETQAKEDGTAYEVARFPWSASGRALGSGRPDGFTKLLVDPETRRILGGGIVGIGAGELIAEVVHAIEMGSDAEDLGLTIHPHPTLSESIGLAAEVAEGTVTDLPPKRKRKKSAA